MLLGIKRRKHRLSNISIPISFLSLKYSNPAIKGTISSPNLIVVLVGKYDMNIVFLNSTGIVHKTEIGIASQSSNVERPDFT